MDFDCRALELDKVLAMLAEETACPDARAAALALAPSDSFFGSEPPYGRDRQCLCPDGEIRRAVFWRLDGYPQRLCGSAQAGGSG